MANVTNFGASRRITRARLAGDQGTSLIELMVGMVLMAIFGGMFTGAVVMMNGAMNKSQAVSLTASQLNQAFLTLDETVRYASAISVPGQGALLGPSGQGDWYVELRTTNTGAEVCTQLHLQQLSATVALPQLQRRTWTAANPTTTLSAWAPLASGITNGNAASGSTDQPFALKVPLANVGFQQLTLTLVSPAGSGKSLTTSRSAVTFTAADSSIPVPVAPFCQQQTRP